MAELKRTIVLVGMMGAGKTALGRRLAQRLGVDFRDTDAEIEAAAGNSVTEIFSRLGEASFRDGERRVVSRLLEESPHVLATGGGAFMDRETRTRIKQRAISIWLRAPLELLLERTLRRDTRPLLRDGNPRETIQRLLIEREPVYAEADLVFDSGNDAHHVAVERLLAALIERGELRE